MASFNKITIVGYLGADPTIKYTPSGEAVCNFSVATTERRKDAQGEFQDQTTWFKVTVWRRQAELANQYLSKGKQVYVEGRLRQAEYTDRDGNKRTTLEVTASDIQFLGSKDSAEDEPKAKGVAVGGSNDPQSPLIPRGKPSIPIEEEDIPFS